MTSVAAAGAPILCLVTDRRRASGDAAFNTAVSCLVGQARYAAEAGIDLIQVRERDLEAGQLVDLAGQIVRAVAGSRTRVVVNDRVDVALAAGADGVHLRGDSSASARVRTLLAPPRVVGRSVHAPAEAAGEGSADYLIAGTTYATVSKPGREALLGLAGLRAVVAASRVPVLAIGGVSADRMSEIAGVGAAGVAGIGLFLGEGAAPRVVPLSDRVTDLHRRFLAPR